MPTVRALIRRSLLLLGVLSSTEPMPADEAQDGLDTLNALIASWAGERLTLYHTPRLDVPLTPGQATYTWGTGGAIPAPRPLSLERAVLRVDETDWPVEVVSQTAYEQGIMHKAQTSPMPCLVYYEPAYPLGVLHVWGVPETPGTLGLFPVVPLQRFASIDTVVSLPEGYERLLVTGLAIELSPMYGKEVSPTIAAQYAESKANVKRVNAPQPVLGCDPALSAWVTDAWSTWPAERRAWL